MRRIPRFLLAGVLLLGFSARAARETGTSVNYTLSQTSLLTANAALAYGQLYLLDASLGNRAFTLPPAAGKLGQVLTVRRIDASANTVTLVPSGADTINIGLTSQALGVGQGLTFRSSGISVLWTTAETGFVPTPGTLAVSSRATTGATNFSVAAGTQLVICNNGAVAISVTLPSAALNAGRFIYIHRDAGSTGAVTLNAVAGNIQALSGTFAASTTLRALNTYGQNRTYWSDGTQWNLIGP